MQLVLIHICFALAMHVFIDGRAYGRAPRCAFNSRGKSQVQSNLQLSVTHRLQDPSPPWDPDLKIGFIGSLQDTFWGCDLNSVSSILVYLGVRPRSVQNHGNDAHNDAHCQKIKSTMLKMGCRR